MHIFRRPIIANSDNAVSFSKAAIVFHNYLSSCLTYCPLGYVHEEDGMGNIIQGSWRNDNDEQSDLLSLGRTISSR